eukprot:TRINITY_DN4294_c0_g3_i1.p1 TRINITY_DN4294_c0_g3~~TRINITY_DN4294_c0_g3_i1.p1  ORF type:complete len:950 (-),score=181.16 TRINITY_DN4294_c0_g3_i1:400-3249(-)
MSGSVEKICTMLVSHDKPASLNEIKGALEGSDEEAKLVAMQKAVLMLLSGEQLPGLFITIVRYVLPSENHSVQKLLLMYLETIEKTDQSGKLLPEMILICQNLRNNLQHPNEYIRGVTLRFLCRIKEEEIVEPLIPSILQCLEHRHSFVRRNAVLALNSLYSLPRGELLLVDAPEMVEKFLQSEQDLSARRNAFMMLVNYDTDRAKHYLQENVDSVANWGDILQLAVLDLIRKVCRTTPNEKGRYIKIILALLQSQYSSVVYECAVTLVTLSQAPTAIKAAANCYCQLLVSQSDNNVKLIVLDKLQELKVKHREVMQDMLMDILRALASPNLDVRQKTLALAMDLVNQKNIEEVVMVLKKEVVKTQSDTDTSANDYRQILVQAIHNCARKFPDVAGNVVHVLMDFLGDSSAASALDVIFFVREIMETNPPLRDSILERLRDSILTIRTARVLSSAMWILGEYSVTESHVNEALDVLKESLGPLPLFKTEEEQEEEENNEESQKKEEAVSMPVQMRPVVLPDGTYATQASVVDTAPVKNIAKNVPNLRGLLLGGDFFLGGVYAVTLTKLLLRLKSLNCTPAAQYNKELANSMLVIVSILKLGKSKAVTNPIDQDSYERMTMCLQVLASPSQDMENLLLQETHNVFSTMIEDKQTREAEEAAEEANESVQQPDDLIDFHHLIFRKGLSQMELEDEVATDLQRATGLVDPKEANATKLNRILQLTGFSDAVYAEAYVTVHQYDIVLDITVINRSDSTMQNLCIELATMGDLKLVERPQNYTLAPNDSKVIRANIKVSSTETGVIFGNIVYESGGYSERNVVVLNDIHIDIMDYIHPATCQDVQFRNMWAEFEWENKVAVNTTIPNVKSFLEHLVKATNMKCLTPPAALVGDCGYLAANLYAKSVFGEDALVNVSVEQQGESKVVGYIRIRSKTQGIALSLGDKITLKQKGSA